MNASAPGRVCPPGYRYPPSVFARPADLETAVLYVAGGLYGNLPALREIERMAALEAEPARIVFNGDFHWFDAAPEDFLAIDRAVAHHVALRGNVETELAANTLANGCGCAYPESVADDDVARSNEILARLREVARAADVDSPGLIARLSTLSMHAVAAIDGVRIGIVHGDAWSLAGWQFAHDQLHDEARAGRLAAVFEQAAVDGFASSHTCAPALKLFETPMGERFVINNGAAGMANFRATRHGLITRIAPVPVPAPLATTRIYGTEAAGLYVDALAVHFDTTAWDARFASLWPRGSAARVSYGARIDAGPEFGVDDALGRTMPAACTLLAA
jgi:hypothetical protein